MWIGTMYVRVTLDVCLELDDKRGPGFGTIRLNSDRL